MLFWALRGRFPGLGERKNHKKNKKYESHAKMHLRFSVNTGQRDYSRHAAVDRESYCAARVFGAKWGVARRHACYFGNIRAFF